MAQFLGTRRDWAIGIGPLIPRSDLLEAHAYDFEAGSSSVARDATSGRDEEMSELRRTVRDLAARFKALFRHSAGPLNPELASRVRKIATRYGSSSSISSRTSEDPGS